MIQLAAELRAEIDSALLRLRKLTETDVARDRGPGKWVKKEIFGHLIDSASNNHQRFVGAQFEDPFVGPGYDQDAWVALQQYRHRPSSSPVRAIEIKLSQGAKPGLGGVLPAAKVTPEIAAIRGVPVGRDCISPSSHTEFHDVDSMLDFVERLADAIGLPVGIKSAVGD